MAPTIRNLNTARATKAALKCEKCGNSKRFGDAFCNNCYYALPRDLRQFLFRPIGDGFEGAYEVALEWLTDKYGVQNAN